MKVKELIAMLNERDPEAIVLISGYETIGGTGNPPIFNRADK